MADEELVQDAAMDADLVCEMLPEGDAYRWAFLTRKSNTSSIKRVLLTARKCPFAGPFEDLIASDSVPAGFDLSEVPIGFEVIGKRIHSNPPGFRTAEDVFKALNDFVRFAHKAHGDSHALTDAAHSIVSMAVKSFRHFGGKIRRCDDAKAPYCAACGTHRAWETNCVMVCERCPMRLHMRCHGLPPSPDLRHTFVCNACKGLPSELDRVFEAADDESGSDADRSPATSATGRVVRKAAIVAQHSRAEAAAADDAPPDDPQASLDSGPHMMLRPHLPSSASGFWHEITLHGPEHAFSMGTLKKLAPPSSLPKQSLAPVTPVDAAATPAAAAEPLGAAAEAGTLGAAPEASAASSSSSSSSSSSTLALTAAVTIAAAPVTAPSPPEALKRASEPLFLAPLPPDGKERLYPAVCDPVIASLVHSSANRTLFNRSLEALLLQPVVPLRVLFAGPDSPTKGVWQVPECVPVVPGTMAVDEFMQLNPDAGNLVLSVLFVAECLVLARLPDVNSLQPRPGADAVDPATAKWCAMVAETPSLIVDEALVRTLEAATESADKALLAGVGWDSLPPEVVAATRAAAPPATVDRVFSSVGLLPEENAALIVGFQEAAAASVAMQSWTSVHQWAAYRASILSRRFRVRSCRLNPVRSAMERSKALGKRIRKAGLRLDLDFRCCPILDGVTAINGRSAAESLLRLLDDGALGLPWRDSPLAVAPPSGSYLGPAYLKGVSSAPNSSVARRTATTNKSFSTLRNTVSAFFLPAHGHPPRTSAARARASRPLTKAEPGDDATSASPTPVVVAIRSRSGRPLHPALDSMAAGTRMGATGARADALTRVGAREQFLADGVVRLHAWAPLAMPAPALGDEPPTVPTSSHPPTDAVLASDTQAVDTTQLLAERLMAVAFQPLPRPALPASSAVAGLDGTSSPAERPLLAELADGALMVAARTAGCRPVSAKSLEDVFAVAEPKSDRAIAERVLHGRAVMRLSVRAWLGESVSRALADADERKAQCFRRREPAAEGSAVSLRRGPRLLRISDAARASSTMWAARDELRRHSVAEQEALKHGSDGDASLGLRVGPSVRTTPLPAIVSAASDKLGAFMVLGRALRAAERDDQGAEASTPAPALRSGHQMAFAMGCALEGLKVMLRTLPREERRDRAAGPGVSCYSGIGRALLQGVPAMARARAPEHADPMRHRGAVGVVGGWTRTRTPCLPFAEVIASMAGRSLAPPLAAALVQPAADRSRASTVAASARAGDTPTPSRAPKRPLPPAAWVSSALHASGGAAPSARRSMDLDSARSAKRARAIASHHTWTTTQAAPPADPGLATMHDDVMI